MSEQPDYVSFEPRGRDEVLSQIGSFAPNERAIFQRLCDGWSPRIDVDRFLSSAQTSAEQERSALERLMAKLRAAEIGVLTTRAGRSGREPHQIVLTRRGSLDYWVAVLEEAIARLIQTGFHLLPSEQRLKESRALPPDYHVVEADSSHLITPQGDSGETSVIYRIRLMGSFRILFTTTTAAELLTQAVSVLKRDLAERGIVEELARLKDTSISEIRRRMESKAPDVWLDLTKTLVKQRSTVAFRKNFDETDEVFQLAYLVMIFVDARIGAAKEQQKHEHLVTEELESLAEKVRAAGTTPLTQEEFSTLVEDAQTKLGPAAAAFASRLSQEFLRPRPRRKLPPILYIHGVYVHAACVAQLFEQSRTRMSAHLSREYTELMEAFLRGRTPEIAEIFGSRDMLNEDIERRVNRQLPLFGELVARPQVVAEAIIHDAKQRREVISTEELKALLAEFFNVESSELKPLCELLGLSIVGIYDEAFARTSVFRQILLRLSGRHESLRATYTRRFGARPRSAHLNVSSGLPPGRAAADGPGLHEPPGVRAGGRSGAADRPETASTRRRRPAPRPARPKTKSRDEIEQVWQEFGKALHTKPSEEDPS